MTKYFCDCCTKECPSIYVINIPVHVTEARPSYGTMLHGKIEGISGNFESVEVCLACYNAVLGEAWKKIQELTVNKP